MARRLHSRRANGTKLWWKRKLNTRLALCIVALWSVLSYSRSRSALVKVGNGGGRRSKKNRPSNSLVCGKLAGSPSRLSSPLWEHFQKCALKGTPPPEGGNEALRARFEAWTRALLEFYTLERLQRSSPQRPPRRAVARIEQIVAEYPSTGVPLRILVAGGSVTAGFGCTANPVGYPSRSWAKSAKDCAWPGRLQHVLRESFFGDVREPGVVVHNMAMGGISSDVTALTLEYQLLPEHMRSPDIVLLAHSANDAQVGDFDALFYDFLQDAVRASFRMRECDDDLPLVGLVDDYYGNPDLDNGMQNTARLYAIASWNQVMMINYGNTVRHTLLRRYDEEREDPLMGGDYNLHMGMGFHIGMAWTLAFNILLFMEDACLFGQQQGQNVQTKSMNLLRWDNQSTSDNFGNTAWTQLPSRLIPKLKKTSTPSLVRSEWTEQLSQKQALCLSTNSTSQPTSPVCTFAWIANVLTGILHPPQVQEVLSDVLIHADGWKASGFPVKKPRTGWYAEQEMASFSLKIPVSSPALYMTILSMESYRPKFVGTNLQINLQIQRDFNRQITNSPSTAIYNISGYHETKTSVNIPHKFGLPDGGAQPGDVILFNATLISGGHFKIAGMAFCRM